MEAEIFEGGKEDREGEVTWRGNGLDPWFVWGCKGRWMVEMMKRGLERGSR